MLSFFEVRDPSQTFHALGSFLKGAAGPTYLSAEGDLSPGSNVSLHVQNADPNKALFLISGNFEGNRTFRGGNFVPGHTTNGTTLAASPAFTRVFNLTSDANGDATFTTNLWELAPPGSTLYWQVIYQDLTLSGKFAFSNAISFTRP